MPNKTLLILLGNQLFPIEEVQQANCGSIFYGGGPWPVHL